MTSTSDALALQSPIEAYTPAAGADLEGLYHTLLHQLAANVESLVAHAFAAHAARLKIPLPTAIEAVLTRRAGEGEPAEPEPSTATGNTGLDFLNEQLQRGAAAFSQPQAVPTPLWLQPFTLPEKVRFTRTPDPVLRWERSAPTAEELAAAAREAARLAAEQAARVADEERERARLHAAANDPALPAWRRPFTLPPGVRYTRTPDLKVRKADASGSESVLCEAELPARNDVRSASEIDATMEGSAALDAAVVVASPVTQPPTAPASGTVAVVDGCKPAPERPETYPALAWNGFSLSTLIEQRPVLQGELPSWIAPVRLHTTTVEPASAMTVAAMSALFEDADSDGSAVFDRSAFLPDLAKAASTPVPVEADAAILFGDQASDDVEALPALAPAERRAFGSHGIPSFEGAVHYDGDPESYEHPSVELLALPQKQSGLTVTREGLEQNARLLEGVLEDFGVRGEIIAVRPGPVVTLYEFEPAPGVKSSRVMNLADDIARSMSAVSARVAVVQGRNVIGIELPNERRETVFLRELVGSEEFDGSNHKLAIALGKTIGGESVIVDLARMPHLLVAGTTGSGKSVAINTMILSLLYRMRPEQCRLIMVDPKMLELSIYDGIPHLLTPVVTDSKKAVIALKWAVREMEDRYKKMAKVGVRNIDGFNARVTEAQARDEVITRTVQQGFDRETGEAVFVTEEMDLTTLPYIVIIVDEMADLMMVAGKEIEGAIQRLAQMARAAGIHLIMATQRPSVDVITGTIKANFPTRISFQVTSKIDSRTILGEQGAEQLLGQGDMLHMAGGGRIVRVHGPFVSDGEVEKVVWHLKSQGRPEYLDVVTADEDEAPQEDEAPATGTDGAVFDRGSFGEDSADLYDQGVKIVLRDKKCSTSYIQRRLQVGYNKAASIVERMEKEGLVGPANGTGKREILNFSRDHSRVIMMPGGED